MPKQIHSGIIIVGNSGGFVAEYDEREAAVYGHYNWTEWLALDWYERAQVVAHYRMHSLIEAHMQQAAEQASKRAAHNS